MSTPKDALSSILAPLVDIEKQFKTPLIQSGLPDIPLPAELCLTLLQALPEIFPLPLAERVGGRGTTETGSVSLAIPLKRVG